MPSVCSVCDNDAHSRRTTATVTALKLRCSFPSRYDRTFHSESKLLSDSIILVALEQAGRIWFGKPPKTIHEILVGIVGVLQTCPVLNDTGITGMSLPW
jgi:hypothetical protein